MFSQGAVQEGLCSHVTVIHHALDFTVSPPLKHEALVPTAPSHTWQLLYSFYSSVCHFLVSFAKKSPLIYMTIAAISVKVKCLSTSCIKNHLLSKNDILDLWKSI